MPTSALLCVHTGTVKFNQPYKPTLTFCVVKKRHHARLFPMNPKEADRSGNCVAGTVVDTVITHPTEFDFCKYISFISLHTLVHTLFFL